MVGDGRREIEVRNAARLPALQSLFEEFGVRPTYLVTHEMATRPESAAVLRDLARSGRCEIGAHLHPWTLAALPARGHGGPHLPDNLPDDLLDRQIGELTATLEGSLGVRPTTYRAGRNGVDGRSLRDPGGARLHGRHQRGPAVQRAAQGGPRLRGARRSIPTGPITPT